MITKQEWYLSLLARQKSIPLKALQAVAMDISGLKTDHYKGILGIKTGKTWVKDMEAGVEAFSKLLSTFGGDELKAAAAYMTSEAKIRSYGDSSAWRKHLPGCLQ